MRIVIAEDSLLLREGLSRILTDNGYDVVGAGETAEDLLSLVDTHKPDVVITDIKMPPDHTDEGLRAAETIKHRYPEIGVLILSQYIEPRYAMGLMKVGGGVAYLLKDRISRVESLVDAITAVSSGGSVVDPEVVSKLMESGRSQKKLAVLTNREKEVLGLMAQGLSNNAIRDSLYIGAKTLETHIGNIFVKLGLLEAPDEHRRVMAVLTFLRS